MYAGIIMHFKYNDDTAVQRQPDQPDYSAIIQTASTEFSLYTADIMYLNYSGSITRFMSVCTHRQSHLHIQPHIALHKEVVRMCDACLQHSHVDACGHTLHIMKH